MFESFTEQAKAVIIDGSQAQAAALGNNYVGTEHILLAILAAEQATGAGPFRRQNVTREAAVEKVTAALEAWYSVSEADALRSVGVDPRSGDGRRRIRRRVGADPRDIPPTRAAPRPRCGLAADHPASVAGAGDGQGPG